jgi:hypothetical protein
VTNGIRADPRGCVYGSVCGHIAHDACGPGWDTRHGIWTCGRALRGDVQCAGIWCIAHLGPNGTNSMAYGAGTGRMAIELDRFEGSVCDTRPNLDVA